MIPKPDLAEIKELTEQAESLAARLRAVSATLRSFTMYQQLRFWSVFLAASAMSIGVVFIIGGQQINASAYFLVAALGHVAWGVGFILCGLFTAFCGYWWHRWLRWALLLEAVPYVGLAVSFAIAAWRYNDANVTAAPVYLWIVVAHGFLSDFARRSYI